MPAPPSGNEDSAGGGPPSPRRRRLLAAEQLVQPPVDVAPDLVEIGRTAAAALTPLRIVERHGGRGALSRDRAKVGSVSELVARRVVRRSPPGSKPVRGGKPLDQRGAQLRHACAGQRAQTNGADFTIFVALDARVARPAASHLLQHQDLRHLGRRRSRPAPRRPPAICSSRSGWAASTTCSSRSASTASFSVARNAATRSCGRSRMKPTVSDSTIGVRAGQRRAGAASCRASRRAGRRRRRCAPVSRLNSVDLPALV